MASSRGYRSLGSDHELQETAYSPGRVAEMRQDAERKTQIAWLPYAVLK